MNNLAMLLTRSPETGSEAVELSRAAIDLAESMPNLPPPALANILDTFGTCLLAAGDAYVCFDDLRIEPAPDRRRR